MSIKNKKCNFTYQDNVYELIRNVIPENIKNEDIIFVCIGTDRSTGDSLGPLVGTYLKSLGYTNVYGTIYDPVHGMNFKEIIQKIPKNKKIIAIDSSLGEVISIGKIEVGREPIYPGAGVGKNLSPIGDYSIKAIVNVALDDEEICYQILQCTRLSLVIDLAKKIVNGIVLAFPLYKNTYNEVAATINYDQLLFAWGRRNKK